MRRLSINYIATPSYLCDSYRHKDRNADGVSVICCDLVKIDTQWLNGQECWKVKVLELSKSGKRNWTLYKSGSSSHCATAWINACKAACEAFLKSAEYSSEKVIDITNWFERNKITVSMNAA